MIKLFLLSSVLFLTSCGAYKWWGEKNSDASREVASLSVRELMASDQKDFAARIDEKLGSIHSYYLIGQKNLIAFDQQLEEMTLEDIYESQTYLNLIAVRTQAEEIEEELSEVWETLSSGEKNKSLQKFHFEDRILKFAGQSDLSALSMENIIHKLQIQSFNKKLLKKADKVTLKDIEEEYKTLQTNKEFQIYEKNVEHLSHMLDLGIEKNDKKFFPSQAKAGNITGNEFPPKVWSLTFDDGPGKNTSPIVLNNLKAQGLKATFFQLTQNVKAMPEIAHAIRDAGMEIASHSYTHKQLTKVGSLTLEKEITEAVKDLKKVQETEIKFFRLPYGAGMNSPHIRQKIFENGLIHVFWNVDTLDWVPQTPDKIVARTLSLMKKTKKDAGVLLFHDIHQRTVIATVQIMEYLKKDGRRVCTLDEIVTQMNEGVETVCPKN